MASIDEPVVRLRVNDKEFQQAVDRVIKALEQLKTSLKFKDSAKGFEEMDKAASKVKFSGLNRNAADMQKNVSKAANQASKDIAEMGANAEKSFSKLGGSASKVNLSSISSQTQKVSSSVQNSAADADAALGRIGMNTSGLQNYQSSVGSIASAFTNLQTIATGALLSIGSQAVNSAKSFVSQFTSGMTDGFGEYELQMNSIQTILTNTASKGTTLDQVNAALAELNKYADQTIYNFSEMTRNIGTFTAAGVDLDTSVASIKGIANLAAASGSSASQAATAMYQLSQAIAAGRVSLMDWNSVVNAGMGGELFQEALKRTARNFGEDVDGMIAKYGSFRESLTQGQWLTTDVLTETLKQISGAYTEADLMQQGYTEDQAKAIVDLADRAKSAATDILSFGKMLDTWKESIGSGWAQTWQLVFGDFEESKQFWTELYNGTIAPMVQQSADARNNLLEGALSGGGDAWSKLKEQIEATGVSMDDFQGKLSDVATESGQSLEQLIEKYGSLEGAMTSGEISSENIIKALKRLADSADGTATSTEDLSDAQLKSLGYTQEQIDALRELADEAEKSGSSLNELIESMSRESGRELLLEGLVNVIKSIVRPLQAVRTAFMEVFGISSGQLYDLIAGFNRFSQAILISDDTMEKLTRTFRGLFSIAKIATTIIGGGLGGAFNIVLAVLEHFNIGILDALAIVGDFATVLSNFATYGIDQIFNLIGNAASFAGEGILGLLDAMKNYPLLSGFASALTTLGDNFTKYVQSFAGMDPAAIFEKISTDIQPALAQLGSLAKDAAEAIVQAFNAALPGVQSFFDSLAKQFPTVAEKISAAKKAIQDFVESVKNYFGDLLQMDPGEALSKVVNDIQNAFSKISWDGVVSGLQGLWNQIRSVFGEIADGFAEIAPDLIAGLQNAFDGGFDGIVEYMKEVGQRIIDAIKGVLGIHSPSTVMFDIGQNIIQGLINGIKSLIGGVTDVLGAVVDGIVGIFNDVDLGAVLVAGFGVGMFAVLYQMTDALQSFGQAAENLTAPAGAVGGLINQVSKSLKQFTTYATGGSKLQKAANVVKTFAEAIGILAASVLALSYIDTGNLIKSITAIGAIATILGILTVAVTKAAGSGSVKDIAKIDSILLSFSGSMVLLAAAAKIVSTIDDSGMVKALGAITVFTACMGVLLSLTMFADSDVSKAGNFILKASAAFILLSAALKIIGTMDDSQINNGLRAITAFGALLTAMLFLSNFGGVYIKNIGDTILKVSAAFVLLAAVGKIIASMTWGDMAKAAAGLVGLGAIITGLIAATRLAGGNDISKVGTTLIALSAAMGILAIVAKLIATMSWGDMAKAAAGLVGLGGVITGLIAATRLAGGNDLTKVGATLLAMSVSIGILAGVCVLLGMMNEDDVNNGLKSIVLLGAVVTAMSHFAGNAKGSASTILAMSISIGILVGVMALMTLLDPNKLVAPMACMTILMAMFALVEKAGSNIQSSMGSIIVMGVIIAALAGIMALLTLLPADEVIAAAASLSTVMLAFAAAMAIVSKAGSLSTQAMVSLGVMTAVVAGLALILAGLSALGADNAITSAVALSMLLTVLSADMAIVSRAGSLSAQAMVSLGIMTAVVAGLALILAGLSALGAGNAIASAVALSTLLIALSAAMAVLSKIGPAAQAAVPAAVALSEVLGIIALVIAAAGALKQIPGAEWLISEGASFLAQIGAAIGGFVGSIVGGVLEGVTGSLPDVATNLSMFMVNLTPFIVGAKMIDESVATAIDTLANCILKLTAANFLDAITSFITGGRDIGKFGEVLLPLADTMKEFGDKTADLDVGSILMASMALKQMVDIFNDIPKTGGIFQAFTGEQDWTTVSDGLEGMADAMISYSKKVSGEDFSVESIANSMPPLKTFIETLKTLPKSDGIFQKFTGEQKWDSVSTGLEDMADAMINYSKKVSGEDFSVDQINNSMPALKAFIEVLKTVPKEGGWFDFFTGTSDWSTVSDGMAGLGTALSDYSKNLANFNGEKVQGSLPVLKSMVETIGDLQDITLMGTSTGFITVANQLGVGMKQYADEVEDINFENVTASLGPLGQLVTKISGLTAMVTDDGVVSAGFITAANQMGSGLRQYAEEVEGLTFETVSASLTPLGQLATKISTLPTSYEGVAAFKTALDEAGDFGISKFGEDFATGATNAKTNIDNFVNTINNGATAIIDSVNGLNNALSTTTLGSSLTSSLSSLATAVNTQMTRIKTSLNNTATFVSNFAGTWSSSFTPIKDATSTSIHKIVNEVTTFNDDFKAAGTGLTNNLAGGMSEGRSKVTTIFNGVLDSAVSSIRSYYWNFRTAGSYIASGLAVGISAGRSAAVQAAAKMASDAVAAANAEAEIESPSKVMIRSGKWFTEGFGIGITSRASSAARSAADMVKTSLASVSDALRKGVDLDAMDIDMTPTITPVLDLSMIRSQAGGISNVLPNKFDVGGIRAASMRVSNENPNRDPRLDDYVEQLNANNATMRKEMADMRNDFASGMQQIANQETGIYVDGKKLASSIAKPMNQELGKRYRRGSLTRV